MTTTAKAVKLARQQKEQSIRDRYAKERDFQSAKHVYQIFLTNGSFQFSDQVAAETMEKAIEKAKRKAWMSWGFGKVSMPDIRCTHATEVK